MNKTFCDNCGQEMFDSSLSPDEKRPFKRMRFELGKPVLTVFAVVRETTEGTTDICTECVIKELKQIL